MAACTRTGNKLDVHLCFRAERSVFPEVLLSEVNTVQLAFTLVGSFPFLVCSPSVGLAS